MNDKDTGTGHKKILEWTNLHSCFRKPSNAYKHSVFQSQTIAKCDEICDQDTQEQANSEGANTSAYKRASSVGQHFIYAWWMWILSAQNYAVACSNEVSGQQQHSSSNKQWRTFKKKSGGRPTF